jgi:hypothetical protein
MSPLIISTNFLKMQPVTHKPKHTSPLRQEVYVDDISTAKEMRPLKGACLIRKITEDATAADFAKSVIADVNIKMLAKEVAEGASTKAVSLMRLKEWLQLYLSRNSHCIYIRSFKASIVV